MQTPLNFSDAMRVLVLQWHLFWILSVDTLLGRNTKNNFGKNVDHKWENLEQTKKVTVFTVKNWDIF